MIYDDSIIWLPENSAVLVSIDEGYCSQSSSIGASFEFY